MSSSYINQIDAAIAAVQPSSGQNISVVPNPTGGLVVETTPSLTVTGTVSAGRIITGNSGLLVASQTPATSSVSSPAPTITISGNYWNGSASVADAWTLTSSYINSGGINPPGTNDDSVITLNYVGGLDATGFFIINAFQTNIHSECIMASASAATLDVGGNTYDGSHGTFTSVANAISTLTTYTGPPNTEVPPAGTYVTIAGFTNSGNNGRFIVQGSTDNITFSTITVYNSSGIVESHAATWISDMSNGSGKLAALGNGSGTYNITGTAGAFSSNTVMVNSDPNANTINMVLSMQGNATDSAFFHVINNGATGNHGLEMGAVVDGTGANPVFAWLGHFNGVAEVNLTNQLTQVSSLATGIVTKTSSYVTALVDYTILVNSAGAATVTLTTTGIPVGQIFRVKNINTGAVTIQGQTGNIDGVATFLLVTQNSSAEFQWDGSNWWVF